MVRGLDFGFQDEERRIDEHIGAKIERSQASRTGTNGQGRERERAVDLDEMQTSASHTQSRLTVCSRLCPMTNVDERLGP